MLACLVSLWLHGSGHAGEDPGNFATAKNDVDVYNRPVEPRKVIGMMRAGTGTNVLEYHPDGWCKLGLKAFIGRSGWVAADHLRNCPPRSP
jgi:hypothetical protein